MIPGLPCSQRLVELILRITSTNIMSHNPNLSLWDRYGDDLLVVQPFMDSVIARGEGCYLIDAGGRRILDLAAGQFCSVLGHNHKGFIARLKDQLDKIIHLGDQYVSPEVLMAAARLAAVAPGDLNKVIFLSTGSEANECAMRMAKAVTGRTGMLAYSRGYYGISRQPGGLAQFPTIREKSIFNQRRLTNSSS